MGELSNCPNCGDLFVKNQFRDVCQKCWKEEEQAYETVYQYIRKRENRMATIHQVEEATGIDEDLILKFIRTGRLQLAQFPNLGYPCDKCGKMIRQGRLCDSCADELRKEIKQYNREEERKREIGDRERNVTYFSGDNRIKGRD